MTQRVRKAVFPAAGLGTRFLPATSAASCRPGYFLSPAFSVFTAGAAAGVADSAFVSVLPSALEGLISDFPSDDESFFFASDFASALASDVAVSALDWPVDPDLA